MTPYRRGADVGHTGRRHARAADQRRLGRRPGMGDLPRARGCADRHRAGAVRGPVSGVLGSVRGDAVSEHAAVLDSRRRVPGLRRRARQGHPGRTARRLDRRPDRERLAGARPAAAGLADLRNRSGDRVRAADHPGADPDDDLGSRRARHGARAAGRAARVRPQPGSGQGQRLERVRRDRPGLHRGRGGEPAGRDRRVPTGVRRPGAGAVGRQRGDRPDHGAQRLGAVLRAEGRSGSRPHLPRPPRPRPQIQPRPPSRQPEVGIRGASGPKPHVFAHSSHAGGAADVLGGCGAQPSRP